MKLFAQGAEARVFLDGSRVVKERPAKGYRLPVIDEQLRKRRTRREANILKSLGKANVPVPELLDSCDESMTIGMSFVDGEKLRDALTPEYARQVGVLVGKMHEQNVVHGDLTTSNMIVTGGVVHVIDFGLSFVSAKVEDKAVDVHVLDRALESTHHGVYAECIQQVLEGYRSSHEGAADVLARLEVVQKRGRNKKK